MSHTNRIVFSSWSDLAGVSHARGHPGFRRDQRRHQRPRRGAHQAVSEHDDDLQRDANRSCRMHLNDIENFAPFLILGAVYVATNPGLAEANIAFRVS